jgi:hypothetical protein
VKFYGQDGKVVPFERQGKIERSAGKQIRFGVLACKNETIFTAQIAV